MGVRFWIVLYLFMGFAYFLILSEWEKLPDGNMHVVMMDVGQGESILIRTPSDQTILVDGGPDYSILERLGEELSFFKRDIDLVILTHPDSDHSTGLSRVLDRYTVKNILMTGVIKDNPRYDSFLNEVYESGAKVIFAQSNNDLDLDDGAMLDIIWPLENMFGKSHKKPNNVSIVAKILWKDHELLLTGDIEKEAEKEILMQPIDISADILKVPHHGSKTSSSTGFIVAVNPSLAVVSAGKDNRFGHPARDIVSRYENLGAKVRSTSEEGRIELVLY
ncbi:MBL fold metallo-hydrolase [Candidatus Peribacteria bacterium]|jgi:competence protein ComEC|nr:MBL fold metallo-hydrolase [Candidatus Peribacteria bacterium]MBT4020848.1 MBL fold metallo-hydrolase [Candidatus Peribacteria bacterium]MBT4241137.1 MBL fold metallo-hydrolase [Candidatus Peribacteria bacterium]MBT4473859.1 MBL fold metallo-hydrolase [Candidatus Peribacteria bacterium]